MPEKDTAPGEPGRMKPKVLHIVEPTLGSEAGHCYSFVASFCGGRGESGLALRLYARRNAGLPELRNMDVHLIPYFYRSLRRPQSVFLYRRLLREEGRIFLPTATRIDLAILSLAARGPVPPGKVVLYFHWFRPTRRKTDYLTRMARWQPHVLVLGPTESVVQTFRECGFQHARKAPYPITPVAPDGGSEKSDFRHLLFAGSARIDKGFPHVVNLVCWLHVQNRILPISVQASPDHHGRVTPHIAAEIDRLREIGYPHVTMRTETLRGEEYLDQFRGAICLQLYDPTDFADRISGITLDALSCGSPVLTQKGTWMGRMVERFGAGCVVDSPAPETVMAGIEELLRGYERYSRNAGHGGAILQQELSARRLFEIVMT